MAPINNSAAEKFYQYSNGLSNLFSIVFLRLFPPIPNQYNNTRENFSSDAGNQYLVRQHYPSRLNTASYKLYGNLFSESSRTAPALMRFSGKIDLVLAFQCYLRLCYCLVCVCDTLF